MTGRGVRDWAPFEARLEELWRKGKSCSQIAAALGNGITRNAVIGKVHRLNFAARTARPVTHRQVRKIPGVADVGGPSSAFAKASADRPGTARAISKTERWKKPAAAPALRVKADKSLRDARAASRAGHVAPQLPSGNVMLAFADGYNGQRGKVALTDLASHQCKFPIDMPDGTVLYCGDSKEDHSVYCPAHAVRCFTGTERFTSPVFRLSPIGVL